MTDANRTTGRRLVATVFGDPDDHLRIPVLVANFSAHALEGDAREAATDCLCPRTSWSRRLAAFKRVLRYLEAHQHHHLAMTLVDPDALDTGALTLDATFNDRFLRNQRKEFFEVVLETIPRGIWDLRRPAPLSREIALASHAPENGETASGGEAETILALAAPELRRLVARLFQERQFTPTEAATLYHADPEDFNGQIVDVALDSLSRDARLTAQRLTALRGAQSVNGCFGPLPISSDEEVLGEPVVRCAVDELERCGFLNRVGETLEMPRIVRHRLLRWAHHTIDDVLVRQHTEWGRQTPGESAARAMEIHYHAVQGESVEDAVATSRFYGTDLREMGYRLSRSGHFDQAMAVFHKIVVDFDPDDAYAWEYYAYNLARSTERPSTDEAKLIERAYEKATQLEPRNPLYRGRLVGFQARIGRDVWREFDRGMRRYTDLFGGESLEAVSYFAEPVLKGILDAQGPSAMRKLAGRWTDLLMTFFRTKRLLKDGGG